MKYIKLVIFLLLIQSCNSKNKITVEENTYKFQRGEWFNENDSLSGISFREDRMVIFHNMKIATVNIHKYKLLDTVNFVNDKRKILNTYLVQMSKDTLYLKVIKYTDSTLILQYPEKVVKYKLDLDYFENRKYKKGESKK